MAKAGAVYTFKQEEKTVNRNCQYRDEPACCEVTALSIWPTCLSFSFIHPKLAAVSWYSQAVSHSSTNQPNLVTMISYEEN